MANHISILRHGGLTLTTVEEEEETSSRVKCCNVNRGIREIAI